MYKELCQRLETKEGEMELFKIAKQRDRQGKDVHQVRVIKNEDGGSAGRKTESETKVEGVL